MKKGFTLIELLVVVLIIGILAAVAVPQYKKAVLKARFSTYLPLMRSIKEAQERYYMANGEYAFSLLDLDVQMSGQCAQYQNYENMYFCGDDVYIDNTAAYNKGAGILETGFCPNTTGRDYQICINNKILSIIFYYNYYHYPSYAGRTICVGTTQEGKDLCKTFNGVF